ncbi:MAG: DUF4249 family protein [Rikenellaceae bacterium]
MKKYIIFLCAVLVAGCTKIIDVEYEEIDDMYVVQAYFSVENSYILLDKSCNMDEPMQSDGISTATISINGENSGICRFEHISDGCYMPIESANFVAGEDYTLSVEIEDERFTSTARLYAQPIIDEITFSQQQFTADMNLVFCTVTIQDIEGEDNYYRYRFRYFATEDEEEGLVPSWSLVKQGEDGEKIWIMTHLYTDEDRDLEDGDEITIEVQAIDRGAYEYFYTLSLSGNSSTNPTSNLEGGCLGFFSPYSLTSITKIFSYDDL